MGQRENVPHAQGYGRAQSTCRATGRGAGPKEKEPRGSCTIGGGEQVALVRPLAVPLLTMRRGGVCATKCVPVDRPWQENDWVWAKNWGTDHAAQKLTTRCTSPQPSSTRHAVWQQRRREQIP